MADACIECDVAIVGAGFAGALIANELSKTRRINVVILEAGKGIPPNINENMQRFYQTSAKVPESPYTPELTDANGKLLDPANVAAGRPTVLSLSADTWQDPQKSYLIQKGPRPFTSTYERMAGGTSHWLGTCLRFVPSDFQMNATYGKASKDFPFPDWPKDIRYETLSSYYAKAECELGVSADVGEQGFCDISFPKDYTYPMPKIPPSVLDQRIATALGQLADDQTKFLGMGKPVTKIKVPAVPAARNSQPFKKRRACAGNTNCIPICPIQAKYDPTITLNEATNTGFTRIMPRTVASEIALESRPDGSKIVSQINFIRYEGDTGPRDHGCIKAKFYVIAGNAIETARLLLMSKSGDPKINGVANSSDMVGRHLMDHPYYVAWGLLLQNDQVFPYRGPLITSGIGELCDGPFRSDRAAFRVDIGNEGWNFVVAGVGGDPNTTVLDFVNGTNVSGLNSKDVSGLSEDKQALFGSDLALKLNNLITRQFRIGFLVEQTPEPENRVTLSSDHKDALGLPRPQISYNISDYTRRGIVAAYRMRKLIFDKLGATDFTHRMPDPARRDPGRFDEIIDGQRVTLTYGGAGHIMGTYRMGDDPKTSVVDADQCSHDHDNLYLVGSGTFPTGATANPTLTLAALALRTAEKIIGRLS